MLAKKAQAESQLFTLRIWQEDVGHGRSELRGALTHVLTGKTVHFRDWTTLVRAANDAGHSAWSNVESTTVIPAALGAPVLLSIDNPDGKGDYLIEWSAVTEAISYTLEEDDSPIFALPTIRYSGPAVSFTIIGQVAGDWYYRVRAANDAGLSAWSNIQSVEVLPPELSQHVYLPLVIRQ